MFFVHYFLLCADLQSCAEDPLWAGTAQSLFHLPPSPGRGQSVYQHSSIFLPKASLHLLPIPGSSTVSSVLSGSSSPEPPHLQPEEPGAQGCLEKINDSIFSGALNSFSAAEPFECSCLLFQPFFHYLISFSMINCSGFLCVLKCSIVLLFAFLHYFLWKQKHL